MPFQPACALVALAALQASSPTGPEADPAAKLARVLAAQQAIAQSLEPRRLQQEQEYQELLSTLVNKPSLPLVVRIPLAAQQASLLSGHERRRRIDIARAIEAYQAEQSPAPQRPLAFTIENRGGAALYFGEMRSRPCLGCYEDTYRDSLINIAQCVIDYLHDFPQGSDSVPELVFSCIACMRGNRLSLRQDSQQCSAHRSLEARQRLKNEQNQRDLAQLQNAIRSREGSALESYPLSTWWDHLVATCAPLSPAKVHAALAVQLAVEPESPFVGVAGDLSIDLLKLSLERYGPRARPALLALHAISYSSALYTSGKLLTRSGPPSCGIVGMTTQEWIILIKPPSDLDSSLTALENAIIKCLASIQGNSGAQHKR